MQASADIEPWFKKPVAIFGSGISGKAAAELVESKGGQSIVYDEVNSDFPLSFEKEDAEKYALVIASPGFSANHSWVKKALAAGCEVIGELDLACLFWKGKIVAITGTNGKTTLVEFITHSLIFAGLEAMQLAISVILLRI